MVKIFTYLGITLTLNANIDLEVCIRIAKAISAFGELRGNKPECDKELPPPPPRQKIFYRAVTVVPTTLLYGCEKGWTICRRLVKQMN